jgi:hypothetical protein
MWAGRPAMPHLAARRSAIRDATNASSAAIRMSLAAFSGRRMLGSSEPASNVISLMQFGHCI